MSSACGCRPLRKCMQHRKSHDGLLNIPPTIQYTSPVKWVAKSSVGNQVVIPNHAVTVQKQFVSRKTWSKGGDQKTFVGTDNPEILVDPKGITIWKEFTTGFDPDNLNAIQANHGIASWDGLRVYVGRVTKNDDAQTQIIATIYREVVNDNGTWKLCYNEGNTEHDLDESQQEVSSCHVLCDKQPVS